jgi:Superinfection immunity protein
MNALIGLAMITVLITLATNAYLLPALIAWLRHAPDLAAVAVINILLGWTAAGWIIALVLAVRRAAPAIQVIGQVNGHVPVMPPGNQEPAWPISQGPPHS